MMNDDHLAEVSKKGDLISRKAVFYALECMRFASDAERRYAFSMVEQIPIAEPEHNVHDFPKDADCISRQAAIDAIDRITRTDNWQAAVSMALLDLPSAQPKTGKWIKNYSLIQCSECKRSSWSLSFEHLVRSFKYCPNCGAKMEGD